MPFYISGWPSLSECLSFTLFNDFYVRKTRNALYCYNAIT